MGEEKVYLTKEGYKKLSKECEFRQTKKRREIAEALETARKRGDLRENADYDAAKEAYSLNEIRIAELAHKLAGALIIDKSQTPKGKAYLGASIKARNLDSGAEATYELVGSDESDPSAGKISVSSPIGKCFIGHEVGDEVEVTVPAGVLKFKITGIS